MGDGGRFPKWPQDGFKEARDGSKGPQDGPRWHQGGPKMAPRWAQEGPRWPKAAPRRTPQDPRGNPSVVVVVRVPVLVLVHVQLLFCVVSSRDLPACASSAA